VQLCDTFRSRGAPGSSRFAFPIAILDAQRRAPHASRRSEEIIMRKYVDCREVPSDSKCTIAIAADTEQELIEAAVQHAVAVHRHQDTPELRNMIRQAIHEGTPPA
jgi:predicted small metal-binding protein